MPPYFKYFVEEQSYFQILVKGGLKTRDSEINPNGYSKCGQWVRKETKKKQPGNQDRART